MTDEENDEHTYVVVRNDEEQYSIWRADRALPPGWHAEGTSGTRRHCLDHIDEVWQDMRPRSLRLLMEARDA
ncbi:MbtH family protein [Nonomuraea sp. NPDC052116]|uniref:MbtH family protein n=1 Tax=Nonomuraea sp. NPDC052116 TaxID=3155665 RepID=UPI0034389C21